MNSTPPLPIIDIGAFSRGTRQRSATTQVVTDALTQSGFIYDAQRTGACGRDRTLAGGRLPRRRAGVVRRRTRCRLSRHGSVGGLELLRADRSWQQAPPVRGAAVINTGDLMERWTNGRYRSTVHRVRPISGGRDRYSIALSVDPDAAVEVECFRSCISDERPARYPRITAGEHIRRKIAATNEGIT